MRPLWPPWAARTPPGGSRLVDTSSGTAAVATAVTTTEAVVAAEAVEMVAEAAAMVAEAAAMVAAAVDRGLTGPPHLGEPCSRMAATPPPMAATCTMGPSRGPASVFTTIPMAAGLLTASRPAYFSRETGQPPAAIVPIASHY
jgi:hypothetical protein